MNLQLVSNKVLHVYFVCIAVFSFLCIVLPPLPSFQHLSQRYFVSGPLILGPCALNLYGIPRSFKASVLPSLIKNVIRPNVLYKCDYFVHFDNVNFDSWNGRSNRVGHINASEIYLLKEAVEEEYKKAGLSAPRVIYSSSTALEFDNKYKHLLEVIYTEKDEKGNPVYLPWKHKSYTRETVKNVIKMVSHPVTFLMRSPCGTLLIPSHLSCDVQNRSGTNKSQFGI